MRKDEINAIKLPSSNIRALHFTSDSICAISLEDSIQVYQEKVWKTLPKVEGTVTDIHLQDSMIFAVTDQGTILYFTGFETLTYSTKTEAPHFFSCNTIIAITKEFLLEFDFEGNLQDKYTNPINMPFSLYKNNPDYAVLSYEDHLLVWDHIFRSTEYLQLSAPLK